MTDETSDLELLERSLLSVSEMLDRVLAYVQSFLSGEVKGDAAVGRYLMDALGPSTEDLEKGEFNSHLQVRLPISSAAIRCCTLTFNSHRIPLLCRTWRILYGHKRSCRRAWLW